jgi:hypothetical protein
MPASLDHAEVVSAFAKISVGSLLKCAGSDSYENRNFKE